MIKEKIQFLLIFMLCCPLVSFIPIKSYGQQASGLPLTVKGKVIDVKDEPLIGVTVNVKGTTKAAVSDLDGNFTIACSANDVLTFTYIGYTKKEVNVSGKNELVVVMEDDNQLLDEVVVIGYGTTTRKHVVGAVDQISSKAIENRPVANLSQALQGASPNLVIQQKSMNPNDNAMNINIRGIKTKTNNTPLVVIDGLITDMDNMNKLNPADVDNISVLKDAGSAAIYGSRSSNGVILITTKQGKKNTKPTVRFSGSVGFQSPDILYTPLEGWQNATMTNVALANGGKPLAFTPEQIQDLKDHKDAEWMMDYIFKTALQQSYNLSVSGGNENSTYMVSGGFYDQKSNFIGPGYGIKRYNLRTNMTTEYKRFKLNVILGYTRNDMKGDETNPGFKIADASRVPTYYYNNPRDEEGRYILSSVGTNTAAGLELGGYNKHNNDLVNLGTTLEFKITEDLKARGVFGYDLTSNSRFIRRLQYPVYNKPGDTEPARYENTDRDTENYSFKGTFINTQFLLDYNKQFGKHSLSAMAGVSQEILNNKGIDAKTKYTDPDLGIPVSDGDQQTVFDGSRTEVNGTLERVIQSVFGRVSYNYADKYYGEVTVRTDGSSRFPSNNRWGTFPSVTLGWRPSEESFMDFYKEKVGDLKIRGSWGILGNQEISDYQYFTTYTAYLNSSGFNNTALSGTGFQEASPDLKWEKVKTFNLGADFTFLSGALGLNIDYFYQKTTDILDRPITPLVYGTELGDVNIGTMENRGWEVNLRYGLATGGANHYFTLNVADTKNKVIELAQEQVNVVDENVGYISRRGLPLGAYYGLKTNGFFQSYDEIANSAIPNGVSLQPGDVKYIDRNNDGVIDDDDRFYLGDGFPHLTFGFTYNVEYKGFDLSMLIQGVGKRKQAIRGDIYVPFHNGAWYPMIYKHQLDTWSPVNTDAKYPRLTDDNSSSFSNNWRRGSDIFILDGKYLRLKNIQIGYTLPQNIVRKVGLGKVRAYVDAQNLFTLSKNSFLDPESSEFNNNMKNDGTNSGRNYPTLKYYGFGIDIEF